MKVPRYNYAAQLNHGLPELLQDLERMLVDGRYVLTQEVAEFEQAFAAYLQVDHVRGVNSGTDALILALLVAGVGSGDEVVTQANTFHATVAAIRLVGATPVLTDIEDVGFSMNTDQLEAVITPRTRVLLPVHLYGRPAPMKPILESAKRHGLVVIEDAAQAHGARFRGRPVGTLGDLGCFSFHPSKNLAAAGDGGAVVSHNAALDEEVRRRRELGQCGQNHHVVVGLNSKLDAVQARILSLKLRYLEEWNQQRRRIAQRYREGLSDVPVSWQQTDAQDQHVYHLFQIRTEARDRLQRHLEYRGIDVVVRYPTPIHLQPAFADVGWRSGQFPVAERLAKELLCLPIRPDMSDAEIAWTVEGVASFFGTGG